MILENSFKSNRPWTEAYHQIFGGWEVQTIWNLQKNIFVKKVFTNKLNITLPLQAWVENTVSGVKIHWLSSKEKVLGAAVSKDSHADSLLGDERIHHNWFPWKMYNYKQYFLLQTLLTKFTLFIEWALYIYIYIYIYIRKKKRSTHTHEFVFEIVNDLYRLCVCVCILVSIYFNLKLLMNADPSHVLFKHWLSSQRHQDTNLLWPRIPITNSFSF